MLTSKVKYSNLNQDFFSYPNIKGYDFPKKENFMKCPRCQAKDCHITVKSYHNGYKIIRYFFCKICGCEF